MRTLQIDLGARSYPIHIGQSLLSQPDLLTAHIKGRQVMVVSNETVAPLYLQQLLDCLGDFEVHTCILKDGEQYKNQTGDYRTARGQSASGRRQHHPGSAG